jgi:hypothetical protein
MLFFLILNSFKNVSRIFKSYTIFVKQHFKDLLMEKKHYISDQYGHIRPTVISRGAVCGSLILQCPPAERGEYLALLSWSTVEPVTAALFHWVLCVNYLFATSNYFLQGNSAIKKNFTKKYGIFRAQTIYQ